MKTIKREISEINAGSMADIAFLLLLFFLVTGTIATEKGLPLQLPPSIKQPPTPIKERNLLKVFINAQTQLLVEDELMQPSQLREKAKQFIDNKGIKEHLSENPQKAIISLKTSRGTKYKVYIQVLDELKAAYHELRAAKAEMSVEDYLNFDKKTANKNTLKKYREAKESYLMQISEAEES